MQGYGYFCHLAVYRKLKIYFYSLECSRAQTDLFLEQIVNMIVYLHLFAASWY